MRALIFMMSVLKNVAVGAERGWVELECDACGEGLLTALECDEFMSMVGRSEQVLIPANMSTSFLLITRQRCLTWKSSCRTLVRPMEVNFVIELSQRRQYFRRERGSSCGLSIELVVIQMPTEATSYSDQI